MAERDGIPKASPMKGWEVSGIVAPGHDEELLVSELGGVETWPDPEMFMGVAGVQLRSWADDMTGGYLTVWGPDREACVARWRRVAASIDFDAMWGTDG